MENVAVKELMTFPKIIDWQKLIWNEDFWMNKKKKSLSLVCNGYLMLIMIIRINTEILRKTRTPFLLRFKSK